MESEDAPIQRCRQNRTCHRVKKDGAVEFPPPSSIWKALIRMMWIAILLGLIVEALILIVATGFDHLIADKPVVAELVMRSRTNGRQSDETILYRVES